MMGDGSPVATLAGISAQKSGVDGAQVTQPFGSGPITAIQADFELERKIFVSNIPAGTTLDQFCQEMRFAGPVQKISLEYNDRKLAGYGFVTFRDEAGVSSALEIFSKKTFNGNLLSLERTCEPSQPTCKGAKGSPKAARPTRGKPRSSHKLPVPSHSEVSIFDLVRQGPPPPIHGRRFPLSPAVYHSNSEKSPTTLYVGNLGTDVDEERFAAIFARDSPVRTWLMHRPSDGTFKGFGFVELKSNEDQKRLMANKIAYHYQGQPLVLKPAFFSALTEKSKRGTPPPTGVNSVAWPSLKSAVPQEAKKPKWPLPQEHLP